MKTIKLLFAFTLLSSAFPLFTDLPAWVAVEITWDESPGDRRTLRGQLEFSSLPVQRLEGGNFGMANLVPLQAGDIVIEPASRDAREGQRVFVLNDYQGHHPFTWTVDAIPVRPREEGMRGVGIGEGFDTPAMQIDLLAEDADPDPAETSPPPLRLVPEQAAEVAEISVARQLHAIRFLPRADGGYTRQMYRGRFVNYSRAATGDNGTVQPLAATFFGGEGEGHFSHGGFFKDGRVFAAGQTHAWSREDLGDRKRVLGRDNPLANFPPVISTDSRGRETTRRPASTPFLLVYSPDLSRIDQALRLPWGAGTLSSVWAGPENELYLAIRGGEGSVDLFHEPSTRVVENPGAVAHARERAAARGTAPVFPPDTHLFRLSPDLSRVEWVTRFQHAGLQVAPQPDGRLLVKRGHQIFFVNMATGEPTEGPLVESGHGHSGLVVDPRDGSFYVGGEYHSHTGLEPWRCPYLRKWNPDGSFAWSAYDWTGPVVGVEFLRLVSDSAVTGVHASNTGKLLLSGWSDGGNSVFTRQPYDLRKPARVGGTASSIWGAGVLSVAYLIQMNADTMEVDGVTRFLSYLPGSDTPNSISIRSFHQLDSGDVAVLGGSAFGLIETHDAWFNPWWIQYQTNQHAQARGGPFLAVYREGLQEFRLSTLLPGFHRGNFASQGNRLLVFGSARERNNAYGDTTPALLKNAEQDETHADLGAYLLLIDTTAEPNPPQIPERTW